MQIIFIPSTIRRSRTKSPGELYFLTDSAKCNIELLEQKFADSYLAGRYGEEFKAYTEKNKEIYPLFLLKDLYPSFQMYEV
jgi:hypothetical protein